MALKVGAGANPAVRAVFEDLIDAAVRGVFDPEIESGLLDEVKLKRLTDAIAIGVSEAFVTVLTDPQLTTVAVTGGTGVIV